MINLLSMSVVAIMLLPQQPLASTIQHRHRTHPNNNNACIKITKPNKLHLFPSVVKQNLRSRKSTVFNGTGLEGEPNKKGFETHVTGSSDAMNSDIRRLCRDGQLKAALMILHVMDQRGIPPDFYTYASLLRACANMEALTEGKQIHAHIVSSGTDQEELLGDRLVTMYAKCGSLVDARLVFDKMPKQNVFLWNVMITAYIYNGHYEDALTLYYQIQRTGIKPDNFTFPRVLKACTGLSALQQGKEIHCHLLRAGFESHVNVGNALLTMYAKCTSLETARQVFDKISRKDVVSWNAMIAGYVHNEHYEEALKMFRRMQMAGMKPDLATMASIIPVCACLSTLQQGKEIHANTIRSGLDGDLSLGNAFIDMYMKCRSLKDAHQVFGQMSQRDVVSWTAMITGYAENGRYGEALELYRQMESTGVVPDVVAITSIISVCAHVADMQQGKDIHDYMIQNELVSDVYVENALIDMYAKCDSIENARRVFDRMHERDVISWSTMITAYSQNGRYDEALKLFRQMQLTLKPNSVTLTCILPVCAALAALQRGKEIHDYIIRSGFSSDVFVVNALIDMYAKCGSLRDARRMFNKMSQKDVVLWTVMIAGYGIHGHGEDALSLFHQMQQAGIKPDHITFIAVLCACSRAGLVDEGLYYFTLMSQEFSIMPNLKHYACMVDLLGRAGYLDEAQDFIKEMPIEPDAGVWGALLGACRIHRNIELGEHVAERIFELEPENVGYYILLVNIYAEAARWDAVAKVRKMMEDRGLIKNPGCSWIEVKNRVHAFLSGDRSHPQTEKIYAMLKSLAERMEEADYITNTNTGKDELEEAKEYILCGHSEKLAIAFGLINTSPGTPLRVMKNLRMCSDCHNAITFISKIVRREITVRDASQFHRFKDGLCSCGDYG
eukprot:Gb_27879 [translate_table: standard]